MAKYKCVFTYVATAEVVIEADSEEEAEDKACDSDAAYVTLCNYCDGLIDLSDSDEVEITEITDGDEDA